MPVSESAAQRRRGRVLGIVGAVVAVVALGAPPSAGAAGEVPRVGSSGGLGVDVASDGSAARIDDGQPLAVRLAAPGAPFGPPVTVDAAGGYLATVSAGPGGAVLVTWSGGGLDGALMAAYRPPGGVFGAPVRLQVGSPPGEQTPVSAFDAASDATLAWASAQPDEDRLLVRTLSAAGAWGPVRAIHAPRVFRPSLAVAPSGGAVLAWREDGPRRSSTRVVASLRPAGGEFGPARTLAGIQRNPDEPAVAINEHGSAAVAWVELHRMTTFAAAAAFREPGSTRFGKATNLNPAGTEGASPTVSIAPDGRTVLSWADFHFNTSDVWARIRTRDGLLRPAHELSRHAEGNTGGAALATTPALVGWYERSHHHTSSLRTAAARADGTFAPPRTRSGPFAYGDEPLLFADPAGLAFVDPRGRLVRAAG
ncbi:MAG TPA: hypothetical protein VI318_19865 [Baekduia sp.]